MCTDRNGTIFMDFGERINVAGTSMYVFLIASVLWAVRSFLKSSSIHLNDLFLKVYRIVNKRGIASDKNNYGRLHSE